MPLKSTQMSRNLKSEYEQIISQKPIMLIMKGTKLWPQCGYSAKALDILNFYNVDFDTFDILSDEELRVAIREFSAWPTYPQIYVNAELIGGSDVLEELHKQNKLAAILSTAQN